jgi:hypothetical protein
MKIYRYSEREERPEAQGPDAEGLMDMLRKNLMTYGNLADAMKIMQEFVVDRRLRGVMGEAGSFDGKGRRGPADSRKLPFDPESLESDEQRQKRLEDILQTLEEAGYIRRKGDSYELTPNGIWRVGQKALAEVFAELRKDHTGSHPAPRNGIGGERIDATASPANCLSA